MIDTDLSRIDALRRARGRRPWTDDLVVNCGTNPAEFKEDLPACAVCPGPCETDEVCATAVAKSAELFKQTNREQAYYLVESAMKRLRSRDEAEYRAAEHERPNTFVVLRDKDSMKLKSTGESRGPEPEPRDDEHGDNDE